MSTHIEIAKTIGDNLRKFRLEKNLTQLTLGSLCNIQKASISRIESGKINVTIGTLAKMAKELDVSVKDFF